MKVESRPENRGTRLDVFLSRSLPDLTRSRIQTLNRAGAILVDGRREKDGYRLRGEESIEIEMPAPEPLRLEAEEIPLEVRYEDSALAVVEKPAGMAVHPGAGIRRGTLVHALLARFPALSDTGGGARPGIVHRLDKGTSGLIVIAKDNVAHHRLSASFQQREVRKTYIALVHGRVSRDFGTIDLHIGRHPVSRTRMAVRPRGGRAARSEFRVLERSREFTLLEVSIHTGRTHQIRVHLAALGHPVVGDSVYGEKAYRVFVRKHGELPRYFLHATRLEFPHPATRQAMTFRSPLPGDLEALWGRLRDSE